MIVVGSTIPAVAVYIVSSCTRTQANSRSVIIAGIRNWNNFKRIAGLRCVNFMRRQHYFGVEFLVIVSFGLLRVCTTFHGSFLVMSEEIAYEKSTKLSTTVVR